METDWRLTELVFILMLLEKNPNRKTLVKLRISNHKLNIETGRYDNISRCDRICPVCGLNIEDEIHFLVDCPKYSSIRDDFFNKIDNRIPNYKHIPISTFIFQLMNSTDIILTAVSTTRVILFRNARHFAIESLVLLFDLLFLSLLKCFCNAVITSFMAMQIKLIVVVVSSNLDLLLQKHFLYLTSSSNKSSRPRLCYKKESVPWHIYCSSRR